MASNPHSDFTTHNRTLPTLSNLPIFATHLAHLQQPATFATLTRAGPRAAGLSRRCTERPEVFNVPRGLARCSRVGARGPRRFPLPGGWGTRPAAALPLCKACFCGQVATLVVRAALVQRARRSGHSRPGTPHLLLGRRRGAHKGRARFLLSWPGSVLRARGGWVSQSSSLLLGWNCVPAHQVRRSVDLVDTHLAHTRLWCGFVGGRML